MLGEKAGKVMKIGLRIAHPAESYYHLPVISCQMTHLPPILVLTSQREFLEPVRLVAVMWHVPQALEALDLWIYHLIQAGYLSCNWDLFQMVFVLALFCSQCSLRFQGPIVQYAAQFDN